MFRYFLKKRAANKRAKELLNKKAENRELNAINELEGINTEKQLNHNIAFIKKILGNSNDIIIHSFIAAYKNIPAAIVYIDGLTDKTLINEQILGSLIEDFRMYEKFEEQKSSIEEVFKYQLISMTGIKLSNRWTDIILAILSGDTALLIEGTDKALVISSRAWEARSIEEPASESTVRGPHEGFTETLRTNTALIRRKIRDPFLRFDQMTIGLRSQTEVLIAYIEGLANPELVEEVKKRLSKIKIDRITGSSEIINLIEDNTYSIFPQTIGTERTDMVSTGIMDGQVAIFTDNAPFVILVPCTFQQFLISSDDYYEHWLYSSLIRLIRTVAIFIVIAGPGLYVCLTAVNPELMPTNLLISTMAGRSGVPFPVIVELMLMEFTLELLREAGVRLPKPIGQAVSIVGALVLGDAAITANVVSPLTVIVVAMTAIASFVIPSYSFGVAIRIARFPVTIISSILGLYGWIMALIFLSVHLVNLKSFNVPYFSPYSPLATGDLRDNLIIYPLKMRKMRPQYIKSKQLVRSNQDIPLKYKSDEKMKEGLDPNGDDESTR